MSVNTASSEPVKLKRVLTLSDLVIYGIILIQPCAAMPLFGHANQEAQGHAVVSVLLAMVAMLFTAFSYGRMANHYPAAGSAYTYVGRGLHPNIGFLTGFSVYLDYLIIPIICTVFCGSAANQMIPLIPVQAWYLLFASIFIWLNLRGIKTTSQFNWVLMIVMSIVVFWYMGAAIQHLFSIGGTAALFTTEPFYHSSSFSWKVVGQGTALAALTYIGFDGLTTLSEEVENPRRNVMLATVLTCLVTGVWSGAQIYLAQAAVPWSGWEGFISDIMARAGISDHSEGLNRAMFGIAQVVGGRPLELAITVVLLVASVGSGVTGLTGCVRVMYGMGRDRMLPEKFFAHLSPKQSVPSYNILLIGGIVLIAPFFLDYGQCAHLINFGALLAFTLVNVSSIREYYFRSGDRSMGSFFKNFLPPALGAVACMWIWSSLPRLTFIIGGAWLTIGFLYLLYHTRGFTRKTVLSDIF
jgi:putrescine importer